MKVHSSQSSANADWTYLWRIRAKNVLGWILMTLGLRIGGIPWGDYKSDLVSNTDFRKFDGILRQVISGTSAQRKQLEQHLTCLYEQGECVFGIHVSDAALVTCMIDNRCGEHYHFVDSAGGGYTLAAESMKKQLIELSK